jgi:hypothetical protein
MNKPGTGSVFPRGPLSSAPTTSTYAANSTMIDYHFRRSEAKIRDLRRLMVSPLVERRYKTRIMTCAAGLIGRKGSSMTHSVTQLDKGVSFLRGGNRRIARRDIRRPCCFSAQWHTFFCGIRSAATLYQLPLIILLVGLGGHFVPTAAGSDTNVAVTKPNIVFILIDDMGWPDPACYGHPFHETPTIDQLCAEGLKFTDFYAATPVCSSTRATIQSGQYSARVGITDFIPGHFRPFEKLVVPPIENALPTSIKTPGDQLRAAGYVTGYFGKWHLGPRVNSRSKHLRL